MVWLGLRYLTCWHSPKAFLLSRASSCACGMHGYLTAAPADFDFTMTKFWVNGRRGDSCHAVIDQSGLLAESFHERTNELRHHYYPLEVRTTPKR